MKGLEKLLNIQAWEGCQSVSRVTRTAMSTRHQCASIDTLVQPRSGYAPPFAASARWRCLPL